MKKSQGKNIFSQSIMKILTHAIIRRKGGGGNGYFL